MSDYGNIDINFGNEVDREEVSENLKNASVGHQLNGANINSEQK